MLLRVRQRDNLVKNLEMKIKKNIYFMRKSMKELEDEKNYPVSHFSGSVKFSKVLNSNFT